MNVAKDDYCNCFFFALHCTTKYKRCQKLHIQKYTEYTHCVHTKLFLFIVTDKYLWFANETKKHLAHLYYNSPPYWYQKRKISPYISHRGWHQSRGLTLHFSQVVCTKAVDSPYTPHRWWHQSEHHWQCHCTPHTSADPHWYAPGPAALLPWQQQWLILVTMDIQHSRII